MSSVGDLLDSLFELIRNTGEVSLSPDGDHDGTRRVEHQIDDCIVEAVLGERHRNAGLRRKYVETELEQFPEDAKSDHEDEDIKEMALTEDSETAASLSELRDRAVQHTEV